MAIVLYSWRVSEVSQMYLVLIIIRCHFSQTIVEKQKSYCNCPSPASNTVATMENLIQ